MQMRLRAELLRQRTFAFGRAPELMVEPILYGKHPPKAECRGTWKRSQNAEVDPIVQALLVYFCNLTSFLFIDLPAPGGLVSGSSTRAEVSDLFRGLKDGLWSYSIRGRSLAH